jgi:uncharacterized coiled-coil DUF342 family protein
MDEIRTQIRRARRRLLISQIAESVTWMTFVATLIAFVAIAVPKVWPISLAESPWWPTTWLCGALVTGSLAGLLWAYLRQLGDLNTAIEIDLRYGLKERVSSAYALDEHQQQTEAGRALLEDAQRRVERIDVREHFQPQVRWHPLLPVLTVVAAGLVALFVQNAAPSAMAANRSAQEEKEQVRKSVEELRKRLSQRKKQVEAKGLKDTDAVITKVQRTVDELSSDRVDRKKALVKLNNLTKQLTDRREGIKAAEKTRDMLKQLQNSQRGPADRVTQALKKGDMKKALDELKKLSDKLRSDDLTPEEKEQLAKQLQQLRKELERSLGARQALEQKKKELEEQIQQLRKEGKTAEAGDLQQKVDQLQQQLDQLDQQNPQLSKLQQLADQLSQCADCMKQGDGKKAADMLDQMANDLQQMKDDLDNLQTLDDVMDEIADAKNAMNCQNCNGKGCAECQGQGMGMGDSQFSERPGRGLGPGRGMGDRPEEETETGGYRARVAGDPRKGEAIRVGDADGPNRAGRSSKEAKQEIASSFSEDPAPLTHQQLPRREREQTREYFELLRKGE